MQQQLEEEKESLKFIQKMNYSDQPDLNEGLQTVIKVQDEEEQKEFTCKICLETLADNEVIPLSSCEHVLFWRSLELLLSLSFAHIIAVRVCENLLRIGVRLLLEDTVFFLQKNNAGSQVTINYLNQKDNGLNQN